MKKRNLFIVNTYFQLITAINLAMNNFKDDHNDVLLTDISVGIDTKINNIKDTKVFENVFYNECRDFCYTKSLIEKIFIYIFKRKDIIKFDISNYYDRLLFYNCNVLTFEIFDRLLKKNKNLICAKYDEGFGTYTANTINYKINFLRRFLLFKKDLYKYIKEIYLYHPSLISYQCNYEIKKINNLNKEDKNALYVYNSIFNYKNEKINQKYIFFEESFFCDNKDIEDLDLILEIANIVGKDNLLIKLHPRNKIDRFKEYGIETTTSNNIPWEIIQMNDDFSDKVLLTISSGSVLASKLYFGENIKTFLLFNCTNKMSDVVNNEYYTYLNKIKETIGFDNMYIPENRNVFFDKLKEDNKYKN